MVCQLVPVVLKFTGHVPHGKDEQLVLLRAVCRQDGHIRIFPGNCPQRLSHIRLAGNTVRIGDLRFPEILHLGQCGRKGQQFKQVVLLERIERLFRLGIIDSCHNAVIGLRPIKGKVSGDRRPAAVRRKAVRHFHRTAHAVHGIRFQLKVCLLHRRACLFCRRGFSRRRRLVLFRRGVTGGSL